MNSFCSVFCPTRVIVITCSVLRPTRMELRVHSSQTGQTIKNRVLTVASLVSVNISQLNANQPMSSSREGDVSLLYDLQCLLTRTLSKI